MSVVALDNTGWTLAKTRSVEIDELMNWFPQAENIIVWGGPTFRFPFTRATFLEDIHWGRMASFSLKDRAATLAAFGQLYERDGRIHLARLVVNPSMRGQGVGKRLISMLMDAGQARFSGSEFSLFVFRENTAAYECYKSMGFIVRKYPEDMPHGDVCYYLTRPAMA